MDVFVLLSERFPVCRDEKMTGMFREQQMVRWTLLKLWVKMTAKLRHLIWFYTE